MFHFSAAAEYFLRSQRCAPSMDTTVLRDDADHFSYPPFGRYLAPECAALCLKPRAGSVTP
jgi:hypothetical protein